MREFVNKIAKEKILDVLISGYIDCENVPIFHPMYERMYFIFDKLILELLISSDGYVKSKPILKIEKWFEIDEDDKFSLMSIYSQLFKTEQEIKVESVELEDKAFSSITISYSEGKIRREALIDSKNFFGFSFF